MCVARSYNIQLHHSYTAASPRYTTATPQQQHSYTTPTPQLHHATPLLHRSYNTATPQLHHSYTTATTISQLQLLYALYEKSSPTYIIEI